MFNNSFGIETQCTFLGYTKVKDSSGEFIDTQKNFIFVILCTTEPNQFIRVCKSDLHHF